MRDRNPGSVKERLALIEEVLSPLLIETMAFRLVLRLLLDAEGDVADDQDRAPLDVEIALALDEMIAEFDDASEDPAEIVRLQAATQARSMLNVSSGTFDMEFEAEEPPTNDNGPG